jgi:hypothetical protein
MDTGAPVSKAHVALNLEPKGAPYLEVQSVLTGDDGSYSFDHDVAGQYLILVERDGFLANGYGAAHTGDAKDSLDLATGQVLKDIDIRMEATSVISGNVVDEEGAPVKKLPVSAVETQFASFGELVETVQTAETDDLGNFRILDLQPGSYHVGAGFLVGTPRVGNEAYGQTFYPGTRTLDGAQLVSVSPGSETPGIRIAVSPIEAHTITGKFLDSTSHGNVKYTVRLLRDAGDSPLSAWPVWSSGPADIRADGSFVIHGVSKGDYVVKVISRSTDSPQRLAIGATFVGPENGGSASVTVADADVAVEVDISAPTEVRGVVEFEDASRKDFKGVRISLEPEVPFGLFCQVRLGEDGAMDFQNIVPGRYMVSVMRTPRTNVYVKKVRCGGGGESTQELRADAGSVTQCTVTIADDVGTLSGQVKNGDKPAPDVIVVAIPTRPELRRLPEYRESTLADGDGRYEIPNLVPGDYEIFAVRREDGESYLAADFAERHHRDAESVTIDPRGSQTLILKIPPRQ